MAKKKKESLSRTLAEVSKGVTKTVANDKSVSAKVRKQAKSDYRKASRISNSSASKNYISNSRLRRAGNSSTSAVSASMANRMRGESASQRNAGGNTIREIARRNTPKKNSVSRTYSELQNKTKDMNLTDTAVGRGMARAGLTAKGTAKEVYGGVKTTFSAIRDPNEERNIKADRLREQRGEQTKGNKYEGAYDKLRNAQRDNREQREKDLKSASKVLESASADKEKAKEGLGKAGKFALDVESALLGMAGDAAVGAVTGTGQVGALGSMAVRSFGGGYDKAKREGASDSQAALYAAVTGGKEVLTEKMFNVGKAFSGVFGKGLGDDVINRAAEKGAEKLAKKFGSEGAKNVILHGSNYLASALTEGLEEVASTASDPFIANAIYARAVGNPHSFDAGDTFYDFLVGAALGGLGGGIAEASNYSQGGQVKNVLGKDGLKEVADRVAYADEDSGISDSAKAISQMILNGEDVANAQALKLYKAAEAQEQKNFTQYRDAIKGASSIIERDNLISPSGLTVDESGQFMPSIGDNTNIKFQEARTEARNEAEKLQLKDDVAASIGDTIASIKTGIGVVDDIETIVRYPEAKAVYESVTGETLPSGRKALREYLYKKNAENRVQSAREETEFWKDQAVGLLSQTETEDFGGNGQAVFTKATENLDVNELGNSALTKVRTTINDYYNSAKLGIPFSTLNDIAKPEYDAVSEDIKREAYNAGILDSNDIYKYLDGVAVNKDESIKSSANKENRNANPGKLYVDADNAARKYFTNSQQKMWKALAEEFGIGIHIMDAESFADALRAKGQNEVADSESLPNGFYDNGEIYLNVETPDRATRYVFMHEFTHFLEQTAPKEYSDLRKRMIDALIEDGSLERRLSRKRMQYGEGISQDDLIDEILADSTYEFLNDKDFANGIAKESESLAQAIINAIRNLIRKIRNVLARDEYTPSQNANMYAQLGVLKDMETLWLDAVNAARENAGVGETTDSARFSLTDNKGNALSEGQQEYFKNSKVRDEDGNLMVMYHGTMNAGFTVFDKSKANVEGNSGAGFYFSNQEADSLENYSDHTGADNEIKIEFLAEQIMEMGEWNDVEVDTYEEARNIAIKELERNPGMYEVYINITKPYIRAFDNSTNIYTDIEDRVDDSLVEREDYDTEEEYYDDLYNSRNEQIYEEIDRAFYGALQEVESRYGEIEFPGQYADAINDIYREAIDYERLNFTDIYQALQEYSPSVYNDENGMQNDCTSELTRQFIEEFGYDGIIDKEVSHKFGKMNSMEGAIHAIAFNPEQAKLTINDKPTTNPDIRFSLKGKAKEEIENLGVAQTESGSVVRYSLKSWSDTDKAKLRQRLKEAGFKQREIDKWIEDVNGISEIIALDRERLDYTAADNQTMLKKNNDYYRTLDASTLCAKRILYQGTYNAIQRTMPNTPLLVDDVVRIRQMLDEHGLESPCGICYVESRRKTLGKYSEEWLEGYKGEFIPTLADVTTTDGLEKLRHEHPNTYNDYMKAMRKKGVANPKVVELRTDYRGEIAKLQKGTIEKIRHIGGLRIQSFSDFETPHLIDMMQAIIDMAGKKLTAQAYTKVPNFAWAFGDTGIKINLSLIAKKDKDGNLVYDEDGRLMFDSKEGMPIEEALKLRERYPENVGTIVVGISEEHIKAAMADDRIDMIIPFHRSGWGKAEFEGLGLTGYEDFQAEQEEYLINPYPTGKVDKDGKPEMQTKPVDGGFYSNDYWDFKKSGKENAEIYLKKCAETGRYPVFKSFLKDNGDGSFSLQEDGSTDGYWKMLIDFKMYDNNGKGVKQKEVTPNFNMTECRRILSEYEGGADTLPVADEVVDAFIKEYKEKNPDIKFSLLDNYTVDNNGELVHLDKGLSAKPQRARYTEERIDDILETYGSDSETYAQAYITSMSPRTFLKLTLSDEKRSEWERAEKEGTRTDEIFPLDTEQLKNDSQTPFLKIDSESGEVLSHEGRHRMLAMYNAGIRNVPVVVVDTKTKYSKTITPSMTLLSQDFGDGNVNYGYKVSVTNLIPTNKVYKDKIMEAYGNKAAIKFSKKEPVADEVNVNYSDIRYSKKVTDKDTIDFLENQEQVEVYRAMALIDGKLYPPMATKIKGEDGKYTLQNGSNIGEWEEAEERPDLIDKKTGKFILKKDNGTSVAAAYNPYIHTSLSPLNDQFSSAYKRPNMVVVKGVIPSSELTSGYRAEGAKDTVGETAWHAGPVATQLNKVGKPRRVILSRWFKPVEIMSDDDVADSIRDTLDGTGIEIPYNVVTPSVRRKLEERGVSIGEGRGNKLPRKDSVKFSRKDSEGNELSDGQIDFFADSKARDEDGNLLVLYHGTEKAGFTVFDPYRKQETPMVFLTDNITVAKGYSGTHDTFDPNYIEKVKNAKTVEELNELVEEYHFREEDGKIYAKGSWASYEADTVSDIVTEMIDDDAIENPAEFPESNNYKVYANVTNPLEIDANGQNWDTINAEIDGKTYSSTNEIAGYAYNNGYDGVIIKNVYDTALYATALEDVSATDVIIFDSNQIKDTGNLNPTKDADIRFSKKESADVSLSEMENVESVPTDEEVYEYMASHPEIYKEMWSFDEADQNYIKHKQNTYAELETKVEQLKQNQKKTHGKVLDEKSVRPAMNELVKSILQASEQGRGVKKTDNKMVNDCVANAKKIFTAYKNSDTELMITTSLNAAESMVESLKFIDDSMYVYYKDLRDYLKNTPIRVSDTIKSDIADYSAWRKSKFGKIRISDVGIPVDDVYTELCEKFPEMFDRELSNPTDQLLRMGEAIEEIQPYVVYLSSEEYDNLIRQTAGDLIDIAVKGRAYKSMADRYEERISAVKQRAEEAKRDAQEKKKSAVLKEREKGKKKLDAEKQKRKDSETKLRADRDTKVQAERDKRKEADKRRKEAYKRRKSMKKLTEDYKWLSDRILKPTDDKHVPDRMVAPLAELLQYIDLETEYSKKFEKKTGKPTMVAVNLRNLKSALEDVSKSSEANWILEDEDLPQMIEELQKRIGSAAIYELDNSELDAVQALLHAIRVDVSNANKAFVASRSIDDTAKAVIWEANEYDANSKKRRSGGIVNQLLNESMVKPMEFFEHLGPTMKSVYMGLRRGMDVQSNRMKETRAFFAEVFEGYGKKGKPGSEVQKWRNEKTLQEFELQSGEKISLNTAQIMSLYCLSKRKQALGHIYGQGICAAEIRDFGIVRSTIGEKEVHKRSTTMVTREDIINITSTLTDEQIKMADKLQDYLNTTVAEWGNETSLLMYDRKKFTEENYFPIKTQDVYLDANFEKRQRDIESIKNFGFTKGTVVNANNPIVIDDIFAVVAKHVNQMILYNAYAPAISDFTRVYNYREVEGNQVESVQAILADTYGGKIIDQYISKFMSDLQSNTQTRRGGYERVANILLANYKKAAIGASPRVALQQPTAMVRALAEIDAKYFVKMEHSPQLLQMATKKDNALKEMLEHCPVAYWKSMGFNQVDMARDIEDIMMNMEWSRLDVLTMSIYGALDNYTWSKIWKAIKAEQKDLHPEVEYESDEFWELCNERAIEVFDKTQVVDSVFHRSDVMRSDNLLIKSITSFMSEPTTTFNMLRSNLMRANDLRVQGKGKEAFKLTGRTLGVYVANAFACAMAAAIADAILKKQTGDDDDEENKSFIEFWLANTIVNFKNNVSPLNLMPITRDFSSFADGWGTKNMFEEGIALVIEDAVAIKDKANDPASTKKTWEELITELAKDSSYLTGIPVKNFMRYGAGILDFIGINAFAAEKDSEGGQSKSLFGEILEMAGFSNGDDSANSQSQSLESQYEESWLTKKLHEAGITEGTRLDNVLNFFGLNKSIDEQKEEHYQDMLSAAKAAGNGYVGVERDEKIYSKATDGYTKLAEAGEFEELARMRRVLVELDVDTTNFDERVESHIKTGIKKQIGEKGDSKLRNRLLNQLKEVYGYTDEQISTDVLAKTDTATAFQKALCEDNYDEAVKQLRYLRQAGLTYDAFIDLYEKRWKVIDAKTTGTFNWPAQGRISSGFGQRWGTLHAGIDIAMPTGTEVVASDGGEVVYTGYNSAMGNYVDIKHSNGYVTRYQHLSSYGVLKGEKVKKGQYIASSGNTGNSTGPHLHFAVYRSTSHSGCSHSTAVDPSIFLN